MKSSLELMGVVAVAGIVLGASCGKGDPKASGGSPGAEVPKGEPDEARVPAGGQRVEDETPTPGSGACPKELAPLVPEGHYYLHISDIHLDAYGDTLKAKHPDTQLPLWKATQEAMREVIGCRPPAFVLFTGDLPGHFNCSFLGCPIKDPADPDHDTYVHHTENVHAVLSDLAAVAGSIPVLYVPGNNDSLGGDYFEFTDEEGVTPLDGVKAGYPAVDAGAPCGKTWSGPCMVDDSNRGQGYYSARPMEGLRVIGLNSIILGTKYAADGAEQSNQADLQLDWLKEQLEGLEPGEKALLAMHIPPGVDAYADTLFWGPKDSSPSPWQSRFVSIIEAASKSVIGLAYGHTHYDELKRIHAGGSAEGAVFEVAISAPGITTNHGNLPAFKLVSLSDELELDGFVTLHAPSADATTFGYAHYRFRDHFDCAPESTLLSCLSAMPDANAVAESAKAFYYADPEGKPAKAADIVAGISVFADQQP